MKRFAGLMLVVALALIGFASSAMAADEKTDATGTWKWTMTRGDNKVELAVTLKQDGEKLTGAIKRGDQETAIADGKVDGKKISFSVTRERNGNKMTTKYSGEITGDTLKGKIEFTNAQGETQSRDWEATRAK
jgi:hypothetical protein